jgi:tyrosine aminotransferase
MDALVQELPHSIGYIPAVGLPEARRAIATSHGVSPEDVVIASGCSGALELVLGALLNPDDILLVPRPGFPLYQVLAELHGASVLHYDLNPDQNWHCNVTHLTLLLQQYGTRVRGMVINNPSNPTGAVYSEQHLQDLCRLCCHYQVTIVADEVYGDMVFAETQFIPLAKVAQPLQVPMISVSGLGKQYLVPGWRVGWAVLYDK